MAKEILDKRFPALSRNYRLLRDRVKFATIRRHHTPLGFDLYGDADLAESRTESSEIAEFKQLIAGADAVIDIGANVGLFTCVAAREGKKVVAIEPHPFNVRCLLRNLESNKIEGVEVLPVALSDAAGVLPLFGGGQGATLLRNWGGIRSNYRHLVPVNTLDNLIYSRFRRKKLVIKMDVEGNEYGVLQGAQHVMAKHPAPTWILEHGFHENFAGKVNPNFQQLFDLFWAHGYEARTLDHESRLVTSGDVSRWLSTGNRDFGSFNYIFTREANARPRRRLASFAIVAHGEG